MQFSERLSPDLLRDAYTSPPPIESNSPLSTVQGGGALELAVEVPSQKPEEKHTPVRDENSPRSPQPPSEHPEFPENRPSN